MKTRLLNLLSVVIILLIPMLNYAQAPLLGTAAEFVIFTTVGAVGNTGTSQITGNVGTNSGAITGFGNVNGVMNSGNGSSAQCAEDLLIAYNQLNSTVPTFFPAPLLGNGQILNAGVYSISGAATLNLDLILNAQGNSNAVFIFQIQGPFSTGANSKVKLLNGALACNVFWKIEGLVSMAAGTFMKGTVIANNAAINMGIGDTLEGRALSTTGAVNVLGVLAYTPTGCGNPVLTGPAAPVLASAECYTLFSANGPVSNAGITHVTGDVGTNVGLTTGFNPLLVIGTVHPIPDGSTLQAAADLGNAYTYLNALPYDIELLYPAQFGHNLVLTPHSYLMNAATTFTDTVYLNAMGNPNAVFVIKINGALSTSTYSKVLLINGTQTKNVYWKVDGAVSINDYSVFKGTIVCNNGAMLLATGVSIEGRALTTTGALGTSAITATMPPGCGGTSSPTIITQPADQTACVGSSASLTVSATGTGLTYQWRKGSLIMSNTGNTSGATSATLTFNPVEISDGASNYNVVVNGTFLPGITSTSVSLVINPLQVPVITGLSSVCQGATGIVYTTQAGMTGYAWSVSSGGNIITGAGTNSITVNWYTSGPQTVMVNYISGLACNATIATVYNVTVNDVSASTIIGSNNLCVNSGYFNYTTEGGMTGYEWIISTGGIVTWGAGSNEVQVQWNIPGNQTVSVTYINQYGCSPALPATMNVTVNPLPGNAGNILGATTVCVGTQDITYSVTPITDADTYVWTLPVGATCTSGAGNSTITVNYAGNASSGDISVYGNNLCGNGNVSSLSVVVNPNPETPVVTIIGNMLSSSSLAGNQWYFSVTQTGTGVASPGAVNQVYIAAQTGWYSTVVNLTGCNSDPSNPEYFLMVGNNELQGVSFNIYPVPNDGKFTVSLVSNSMEPFNIRVFTFLGVQILEVKDIPVNGHLDQVIDLRPAANGIYTIVIRNGSKYFLRKVVVSN